MAVKIIGLIIGVLVLGGGLYYLTQEKDDKESRKIYGIISLVGGIIAVVCALMLFLLWILLRISRRPEVGFYCTEYEPRLFEGKSWGFSSVP